MNISITLPDDVALRMSQRWQDLSRHTLETLVTDAYRADVITAGQVRSILGLATRLEVDALLKEAGAYLDYTGDDLERDIQTLDQLSAA